MHTIARYKINITNQPEIPSFLPPSVQLRTNRFIKLGHKKYIHIFNHCDQKHKNLITEINLSNNLFSYKIRARLFKDNGCKDECQLELYSLIDGRAQHLATCDDKYAKFHLNNAVVSLRANLKVLYVLTSKKCKIELKIKPVKRIIEKWDSFCLTILTNGHHKLVPRNEGLQERAAEISADSISGSLDRQLPVFAENPSGVSLTGLVYYLELASIITVTTGVDIAYRYPPYSIKLLQGSNIRATLTYSIELKASAGENADVTITAIETLSNNSYAVIQNEGKDLKNQHVGTKAIGSLLLPIGCFDVGLHIYTPYGFSGDTNDDKFKDLAKFLQYKIDYNLS